MDLPDDQSPGRRPPQRRELQGPRPTPLKVSKDSHKIKKPPVAPPPQSPPQQQPPPSRQPVIIYAVSPTVIHTNPSEFMTVVQRLTGQDPTASGSSATSAFRSTEQDTTGYGTPDTRPGGSFTQSGLLPEHDGLIPPAFFPPAVSDPTHLTNVYNQDHINASSDHQLHHHDGGGGSGEAGDSPSAAAMLTHTSMLSPASVEFINKWLDQ